MSEPAEEEVQCLLDKWETEELTDELVLTREQFDWLYKAIHIFQGHENQSRFASAGDKVLTEAMIRYVKKNYDGGT